MTNGHGGKRAGAGRKKGFASLSAERIREKVAKEVEDNYDLYWKPQFDKAKKGDTGAFKEIREFAFGKAQAFTDITSDGEALATSAVKELSNDELERIAQGS